MNFNQRKIGHEMHSWANKLFPICRSITGPGVRQTLEYIKISLPGLKIHSVPSGSKVLDWTVPDEWTIRDAYIMNESGHKIVDFKNHNLHVMGYSEPVDKWLRLEDLEQHLYSRPEQPDAIPYVTSYYERRWGFCLTHNQRSKLKQGNYRVVIDSEHKPGVLNYGELILRGESRQEVFLSTYICHPSMANNELSGPVVSMALAQYVTSLENHRYTYRIIFIPESIGAIVYLSSNLEHLKINVIAGFNITCIGDDRCFSYLPSRNGKTLSDQVAKHVLKHTDKDVKHYSWLDRGSDEKNYCAPGIDLPIATIMRSKYGEYPEYHSSLDDLNLVTPSGLEGGFKALKRAIEVIEKNVYLKATILGEPNLGQRGLYPTLSINKLDDKIQTMKHILSYCDGKSSLLDIATIINKPFWELESIVKTLREHGLLEIKDERLN
jgi:aminopeptidase-like protein